MLRKGNLYLCNMTKMGEEESGKGWEQRLDFADRMALSHRAAHLHLLWESKLPLQSMSAQFS